MPTSNYEAAGDAQADELSCAAAALATAMAGAAVDRSAWQPDVQELVRRDLRPLENRGIVVTDLLAYLRLVRWPLPFDFELMRFAGETLASCPAVSGCAFVAALAPPTAQAVGHAIALVSHRPGEIFDPWPVGEGSWRRPTQDDDERWARGGRRVLRVWCRGEAGAF